jgi:hypothetical protein
MLTRMGPSGLDGYRVREGTTGVVSYFFKDDTLMVDLKVDSGTMGFVRAPW